MKLFALIALAAAVSMDKTVETPDVDADTLLEKMEPEDMEQVLLADEPDNEDEELEELPEDDQEVDEEEEEPEEEEEAEEESPAEDADDAEATSVIEAADNENSQPEENDEDEAWFLIVVPKKFKNTLYFYFTLYFIYIILHFLNLIIEMNGTFLNKNPIENKFLKVGLYLF